MRRLASAPAALGTRPMVLSPRAVRVHRPSLGWSSNTAAFAYSDFRTVSAVGLNYDLTKMIARLCIRFLHNNQPIFQSIASRRRFEPRGNARIGGTHAKDIQRFSRSYGNDSFLGSPLSFPFQIYVVIRYLNLRNHDSFDRQTDNRILGVIGSDINIFFQGAGKAPGVYGNFNSAAFVEGDILC
jgi:hypothetical protein